MRIVFAMCFMVLAMFVTGCGKSDAEKYKSAIAAVYAKEKQYALEKDGGKPAERKAKELAEGIDRYCGQMESLDLSGCPADFKVAIQQYTRAWRELGASISKYPNDWSTAFGVGLINSVLRGQYDSGLDKIENEMKSNANRVRDSWNEVEKIGAKYDVAP